MMKPTYQTSDQEFKIISRSRCQATSISRRDHPSQGGKGLRTNASKIRSRSRSPGLRRQSDHFPAPAAHSINKNNNNNNNNTNKQRKPMRRSVSLEETQPLTIFPRSTKHTRTGSRRLRRTKSYEGHSASPSNAPLVGLSVPSLRQPDNLGVIADTTNTILKHAITRTRRSSKSLSSDPYMNDDSNTYSNKDSASKITQRRIVSELLTNQGMNASSDHSKTTNKTLFSTHASSSGGNVEETVKKMKDLQQRFQKSSKRQQQLAVSTKVHKEMITKDVPLLRQAKATSSKSASAAAKSA